MSSSETIIIEDILKSELGENKFYQYRPKSNYVLDLVLEEARQQIGDIFTLYCVDDGFPEIFCLRGFAKSPVVFSSRYIAYVQVLKKLIVGKEYRNDSLYKASEGIALKLIAELSLRRGDVDFAVWALIKSILVNELPNDLRDYDKIPRCIERIDAEVDVTYIVTWFYGIVHELGHFEKVQNEPYNKSGTFSDKSIISLLNAIIKHYPALKLEELRDEIFKRALSKETSSAININNLRNESLADFFSLNVLFKTALKVKVLQQQCSIYDFLRPFIKEITIAPIVISFMEECRLASKQAVYTNQSNNPSVENRLFSMSLLARDAIQSRGLDTHIDFLLNGLFKNQLKREEIEEIIDLIAKSNELHKTAAHLGQGRINATQFALSHQGDKEELWKQFHAQMLRREPLIVNEIKQFAELAETLNKKSDLLNRLKQVY